MITIEVDGEIITAAALHARHSQLQEARLKLQPDTVAGDALRHDALLEMEAAALFAAELLEAAEEHVT